MQHRAVHLGIATDTDSGPDGAGDSQCRADGRAGDQPADRRAGQGRARPDASRRSSCTGSTFTISNFGSLGGRFGTPIINYPEAGILAVGRAREGVVVRDGMLGVGKLLPLSLSADHRVIDGATAADARWRRSSSCCRRPMNLLPPRIAGGPGESGMQTDRADVPRYSLADCCAPARSASMAAACSASSRASSGAGPSPAMTQGRITLAHNCLLLRTHRCAPPTRVLIETGSGDKFGAKMRKIFGLTDRSIVDAVEEAGVPLRRDRSRDRQPSAFRSCRRPDPPRPARRDARLDPARPNPRRGVKLTFPARHDLSCSAASGKMRW